VGKFGSSSYESKPPAIEEDQNDNEESENSELDCGLGVGGRNNEESGDSNLQIID
jgi:hypothetical protein